MNLKRTCLVLLSVLMAVAVCYANYGGGSGTASDPYLIYTADQLNDLGRDINKSDLDKHFALMADIDLSDYTDDEFNIIGGGSTPFSGIFDGRGHVITNFTYSPPFESEPVGIFGKIEGQDAVVMNLGIIEPNIINDIHIGSVAAILTDGRVVNCWLKGGLVKCQFQDPSGGLIGLMTNGEVSNCYTESVTVIGQFSTNGVGCLVGRNSGGSVTDSFATGIAESTSGPKGVLVGYDDLGEYADCFWDSTVSIPSTGIGNITDPPEVIGETTENMQKSSTFINAGWDIVTMDHQPRKFIWRMCVDDVNYPRLNIEYERGDFVCPDGVDILDLAALAEEWQIEQVDIDVDYYFDRQIDFRDWAEFASAWKSATGEPNYDQKYDIAPSSPDGVIDEQDAAVFVVYWLSDVTAYLNTDISPLVGDGFIDFHDYAEFSNNFSGN